MRKDLVDMDLAEKGEWEPPIVPNLGFHFPEDYVKRTVNYLERFGCWPEGGGWADQDSNLIIDVDMYLAQRARIRWEMKQGINSGYEELPEGLPPAMRLEDLI